MVLIQWSKLIFLIVNLFNRVCMEKVKTLLRKLQQQITEGDSAELLLTTVQMMQLELAYLRDKHHFMALDGVWHAPIDTRPDGTVVAAKLGDDGLLPLLHNEKTGAHPDQQQGTQDNTHAQISENRRHAIGPRPIGRTFVRGATIFPT